MAPVQPLDQLLGGWGVARDARPPPGSKFFQFYAVFGKFWQNLMFPRGLSPPPRGSPGSATGPGF